jgi:hypothetical protein
MRLDVTLFVGFKHAEQQSHWVALGATSMPVCVYKGIAKNVAE